MPALIMFLIGVITSTTTSLGEKTNAALRMVGLGHKDDIPTGYEYLLRRPDGTTIPATSKAATDSISSAQPAPADHGLIGNWLHAMVADHPVLTLVLAVLIGLYALYKARQIAAVLTPRRNRAQRFPASTRRRSHHPSHPGSYSRSHSQFRKD